MSVEEMFDGSSGTLKRMFNLRAIELAPADVYSRFIGNSDHSTASEGANTISVADLFATINAADEKFHPISGVA